MVTACAAKADEKKVCRLKQTIESQKLVVYSVAMAISGTLVKHPNKQILALVK